MDKKHAVVQNLEDAGCKESLIEEYIEYEDQGMIHQKLMLLKNQRKHLLEKIHEEQRRLDCLDYLIYTTKKQEKIEKCDD